MKFDKGELFINGEKLCDIEAAEVEVEPEATITGTFPLTMTYMSPEFLGLLQEEEE